VVDKIPKSLGHLLSGGPLAALGEEARRRRDLAERIRAKLPPEVAAHLVTASMEAAGGLVLTMDTPAWAARARYLAELLGAEHIKVKVRPREG